MVLLFTLLNALLCVTTINALDNSSTTSTSEATFFANLSDVLLLDISSNGYWTTDVIVNAVNETAVNNYYDYLQKGWFGQAMRERYAFQGQILDDGTVNLTNMLVDDLILSHLGGYLEDADYRIPKSKAMFLQASTWNTTDSEKDPGRDLLENVSYLLQTYNPLVKRADAYETNCKRSAWSILSDCKNLLANLPSGSTGIGDDRESHYGTCWARAPGDKFMSRTKFKAGVGLIIEDCSFTRSSYRCCVYAQGHIPGASSRRKVCVQGRNTNC
ncbi:hypothetical protein EDB81DRAFT_885558 [Dactylonectria macrodidyma]|uniref:Uncharacterized protein n=1 Tax=Dactylonectria macrodidyma TaxID=307937 RepID=A0A9P9J0K0_9HYPO|nr:hypothetical protein EDB81DRAFT_885558 [Dactylonectria macrodidyma]